MRTHADIVKAAGSDTEVADARGVSIHTVRSWIQRDSIPPEHWAGLAGEDGKLLIELAQYAAANPRKRALADRPESAAVA